ncbi:p-hydroxybenzoic acid efflux subunit AaeA [Posidoniimonas polymericola]|uniref:p-hydroxybenzoic acid efflux subunit AaeA n=1 Tax=Posidoniimonas polymericola TaxID=2528002 RepID=A0A5C5ZEU2_9BACT|nr:HlyD family efflux transporter periplasmic adaptor subunit [Posidoniimonas polymericola]TWT85678.1 p-hydroxybenzoic acid efflux subunit AaeA [Posidoniimonas polymericola]
MPLSPHRNLLALTLAGPLLLGSWLAASGASAQGYRLPADQPPARQLNADSHQIGNCTVDLVDTIELPAPEAGVLIFQGMKEGARVKSEDVIAKIDTRMQEMEKKVATYKYHAAVKRANDDIEIKYSRKAQEVAQAELEEVEGVRANFEKAISDPQYRKAKLEAERAMLAIEKATNDLKLALLEAYVAKGEVEAADLQIERRTVRSPFDGEVTKVYRHQQEWVNPGDPILQLVRMDTLRVEGLVPLGKLSPAEVKGCEVTITAKATNGVEKATGRIVSYNPVLRRGDESQRFIVRAEISNRTRNGEWVLLPGMDATMTIHLGTGGVATGSNSNNNQK